MLSLLVLLCQGLARVQGTRRSKKCSSRAGKEYRYHLPYIRYIQPSRKRENKMMIDHPNVRTAVEEKEKGKRRVVLGLR